VLTAYIEEAMRQAIYERIEDGSVFGSIPGFAGLWADADTEEACQRELRDALEGWILLHVADHTPLPTINGITLDIGTPI
jgi:predicted RNase H-like HicB family nuclease